MWLGGTPRSIALLTISHVRRTCTPLSMCAAALGRFWRMFLIAAVGSTLPFSTDLILIGGATLIAVLATLVLVLGVRRRNAPSAITAA